MRRAILLTSVLLAGALGCDETPDPSKMKDVCPELVEKVKAQCGADSAAYKKHKELYIDAAPTGAPTSDADRMMRARRLMACQAGLSIANEKLDYSQAPNFTVNSSDAELQGHAEQAKKHWEERKRAYEKMSPEEKKKDEAAQLEQRCTLWQLG